VEKGPVRLHPNEILTKRDEHGQEQNAIGSKVVNIEPTLDVVDEDHNHFCQRLPSPNLGFLGLNHLPHRSHQALHHYQEQYGRPCQRKLDRLVDASCSTPQVLSLIPSGVNFRLEGKKNPLVCPTLKYRFVAVPSHGDMMPLYIGGAGVQEFSRSA
jgi:hypothetical protein